MVASINDLIQAGRYVNIIAGIFFWVFGVIGSLFILIIFLSRPQLRRSPSSQYIIASSTFDFIFLALALGYRIMTDGFAVQGALALFFYQPVVCRIRNYITGVANFATLYTKCLCAFDQYVSTCRSNKIRRFSSIKWARIFLTVSTSIWTLMNVPQLIYNDISKVPMMKKRKFNSHRIFLRFFLESFWCLVVCSYINILNICVYLFFTTSNLFFHTFGSFYIFRLFYLYSCKSTGSKFLTSK